MDEEQITPQEALSELLAKEILTEKEKIIKQVLLEEKEFYDKSDARRDQTSRFFPKRGMYFDFKGNPISMWEWSGLTNSDKKIIEQTQIGPYFISTVYIGMDMGFRINLNPDPEEFYQPIIFETMIFNDEKDEDDELYLYQERYCTQEQAREGHYKACKLVEEKIKGVIATNPEK